MNWEIVISVLLGGGIVTSLSGFVFMRLISQVDKLSEAVSGILISMGTLSEKVQRIDKIEDKISIGENRLTGLETLAKVGSH